ncbi:MAG: rhodanese-like domain-containing protein [Burkholderiaceae bacterium]
MQFVVDNWILFLAALSSGVMLLLPLVNKGAGGASKVSPTEAVQLINREKAVLIDVSENAEYASGHVAGAKNVPLGSLEASNDLPKNKTLPLVLVCPTGARAARAVGMLQKRGFEKTRVLAGGLRAWREANLPIEKSA